jgi:hypothetical protein
MASSMQLNGTSRREAREMTQFNFDQYGGCGSVHHHYSMYCDAFGTCLLNSQLTATLPACV